MSSFLDGKENKEEIEEDEEDILDEGVSEDDEEGEEVQEGTEDTQQPEEEEVEGEKDIITPEMALKEINKRNPAIPNEDFDLNISFKSTAEIDITCTNISMLTTRVQARMNHRISKMVHKERGRKLREMRTANKN